MALDAAEIATVSRLLDEALALPASEREAWLAALPAEHRHLAATLGDMLAGADRLPQDDPLGTLPRMAAGDESVARPGDCIGPYRLRHEIGRGGMGSVWLAERADGSFRRQVALKLPRLAWEAGLAGRMARERDIGALLEHPNIARLYDAGVDDRGRPYLALEYIEGQPIDAWCEAQALDVPSRLRLFVQVARAVAYAHGRLVVHRDLKPSNVLVTPDGQAHLLDFGIAKLLHEAADEKLTQQQGRVLTPHYASPEQLAGEPITVQSDVYSLGVLLYELLTGTLPIAPKRATLGAVEEAVLLGDAPLASRRVQNRATAQALRGEVDAILAKATRREPRHRYATADAFAEDIERKLAGEAVLARPEGALLKLRRVVWRHRLGFAATAAVLTTMVTGAVAALVQAQRADAAADRARVVKEFVVDVFKVNSPEGAVDSTLQKLPAKMLLEHGAALIETRFAGQAGLQAELFGVVGGIFVDMGAPDLGAHYAIKQVEVLTTTDAGSVEQAEALLLLARAFSDAGRHGDAEVRVRRAITLAGKNDALALRGRLILADTLEKLGRLAECAQELASVDAALAARSPAPRIEHARAGLIHARLLLARNGFEEAVVLLNQAANEAVAAEGPRSGTAVDIRLLLARQFLLRFRLEEANEAKTAALEALRASGSAGQVKAALAEGQLTMNAYENHLISFDEASSTMDRLRTFTARPDLGIPVSIAAKIDLHQGWLELYWGNVDSAERLIASAAARLQPPADALLDRYQLTNAQASVAWMRGDHVKADRLYRELAELRRRMGHGDVPFAAEDFQSIAENLSMSGKFLEALAFLDTAPRFKRVEGMAAGGERTADLIDEARARVLIDSGSAAAAINLIPAEDGPMTGFDDGLRRLRGEAQCAFGQRGEGLARLLSVIQFYGPERHPASPQIARDRAVAALCAVRAGKRALAEGLARQAREAFARQPAVSPYFKAPLVAAERELGLKLPPV